MFRRECFGGPEEGLVEFLRRAFEISCNLVTHRRTEAAFKSVSCCSLCRL